MVDEDLMTRFINNRKPRFYNFKTRESFPENIMENPSKWILLFNGEDWSNRKVFFADEDAGTIIRYATDAKGNSYLTEDETAAEHKPEKGRVRILKKDEEI